MKFRIVLPAALAMAMAPATGAFADKSVELETDPIAAALSFVLSDAGRHGEFLDKKDAAAVAEFYSSNGHSLVWSEQQGLTEDAVGIADRLRNASADGLDPAAYPAPASERFANIVEMARADVMLSRSIVTYARHAYGGRLIPAKISSNIDYQTNTVDPISVLADVSSADQPVENLAAYNPTRPEFGALRRRLAEVRASSQERPPFIPAGRFMQLGKTDPRVVTLRERLGLSAAVEDPELFDDIVDEAVRAYQEQADLNVDGIVGPGTLGVLNRDAEDHAATILVNMERWRWMPKDLGRLYVRVNVPNYNVEIHRDGEVFHSTRIVVGKPRNQTPIFSDEIEHVIVNPTWNVPASIARKEFLPAMLQNSSALNGYNVYANIKGHFRQVDPLKVNWSSVDMRKIQIKQPPGARNALGRVKFMFPNKHAVYLHDTPSKSLFKKDVRAFSHGCVRVNNPWDFAEALLDADPNLTGEIVQKMVGGREKQLNLDEHIPVHITYFTAWIDADSELQIRRDLYGHDTRMKKALGLI
ncbi:MAG: L,D-transpeptidase family protein [Alphaproteobacteria bacterium]